MNLNEINQVGVAVPLKPLIKLKDLVLGKPYPIIKARIINTKFGEAVLLDLDDVSCFLPKRATNVFRNQVEQFIPKKYGLMFKGILPSSNGKFPDSTQFEVIEL